MWVYIYLPHLAQGLITKVKTQIFDLQLNRTTFSLCFQLLPLPSFDLGKGGEQDGFQPAGSLYIMGTH